MAYVVMDPNEVDVFLTDLSKYAIIHGLTPNYGRATSDDGRTNHVIEAPGRGLVLYMSNLPTSAEEGCYGLRESGPNPGQFVLASLPAWWMPFSSDRAIALTRDVTHDLLKAGYHVLKEPASPCSADYLQELHSK
jgi:hypothetical protein